MRIYGHRPKPDFKEVNKQSIGSTYHSFLKKEKSMIEKMDSSNFIQVKKGHKIGMTKDGCMVYSV